MGWSGKVPPPDPRIGEAAMQTAALGRESLDWFKNWYETTGRTQEAREAETNQRASDQAFAIADENQRIARETYDYQTGTFRPLERGLVADAAEFSTRDFGDRRASQAAAEVEQAVTQQRAALARDQARMGVSPSSGVAAALDQDAALRAAAMKAGASTAARDNAEAVGFARRMDVTSLGRGLPSQQASASQIALSGAGAASGITGATGDAQRANASVMGQGFGSGINASDASGRTLAESSRQAQSAAASNQSTRAGLMGTLLGGGARIAGAAIRSDVNAKEAIEPVEPNAALMAIRAMPVAEWSFKGEGDRYVGPMSQDVYAATEAAMPGKGAKVAPTGKKIDLVSMSGMQTAAIQALAVDVERIKRALAGA